MTKIFLKFIIDNADRLKEKILRPRIVEIGTSLILTTMTKFRKKFQSGNPVPSLDTSLDLEEHASDSETSALCRRISATQAKDPVREEILQRFEKWLDNVLAEEKHSEGIADEILSEVKDENASFIVGSRETKDDLYSTWSAMTALTQEVKLQGRAFKHLSSKMDPMSELGESIGKLLETYREALYDTSRLAEEIRAVRDERENELKRNAQDRSKRELISILIDIRDKLIIGLRSADESRRKLDEYRNSNWLKIFSINKSAVLNHMFEIVGSLRKGYMLGLDRLDETMQQFEIFEIICEGKPFDPRLMNVVDIEETVDKPDGIVLEVYRTGYMIDTDVLRSAEVKVARVPEQKT